MIEYAGSMKKTAILPIIFILSWGTVPVAGAEAPSHPLLDQAKRETSERFDYAVNNGARIGLTKDGKSFFVLWTPPGTGPDNPPPMIATIHGHASWAFDEFFLWHRFAQEHGYGIFALQWWLGEGERFQDYLAPREI